MSGDSSSVGTKAKGAGCAQLVAETPEGLARYPKIFILAMPKEMVLENKKSTVVYVPQEGPDTRME